MDFDILKTYLAPDVFILIPVLYVLKLFLMKTPKVPMWLHAWILLIVADIACVFVVGNNINAFVQAVLVTGSAMYLKNLIKHTVLGLQGQDRDEQTGEYINFKND